jgi:CheY-like chemotaxis protein
MTTLQKPAEFDRKLKILAVDDEEFLQKTMDRILTAAGHEVIIAGSGEEALRLWEQANGSIELVITDLLFPNGMGGYALAQAIWDRAAHVPFVFSSGQLDGSTSVLSPDQEEQAAYLEKPYGPPELRRAVEDVILRLERAQ